MLKANAFWNKQAIWSMAIRVKKGSFLFLLNLNTDLLLGVFRSLSDGKLNIEPDAWNGNYPYQVKVESLGDIVPVENAKKLLKSMGISRSSIIEGKAVLNLINFFRPYNELAKEWQKRLFQMKGNQEAKILEPRKWEMLGKAEKISDEDVEEIPQLQATTLWDFPRQSYGKTPKGDNKYAGVTPAELIWNLVWRYTELGDLVVDPMCGSGTTLDVCKEEQRRAKCYDISHQTGGKM